jgi:hypothetical protein
MEHIKLSLMLQTCISIGKVTDDGPEHQDSILDEFGVASFRRGCAVAAKGLLGNAHRALFPSSYSGRRAQVFSYSIYWKLFTFP